MLETQLVSLQSQIGLKLDEIRGTHIHKVNRGSNVEQIVRDFLRQYLPPSSRVGEGEVVDSSGAASGQVDVVVTNEHHPYLNDLARPSVFFVEGILAAGEVKSVLNGQELKAALQTCDSFKALRPQLGAGTMFLGNDEDNQRFIYRRPFFLFAFTSELTLETVCSRVQKHYAEAGIGDQLDAIVLLDRGVIINVGEGTGRLVARLPDGSLGGFATSLVAAWLFARVTPSSVETDLRYIGLGFEFLGVLTVAMGLSQTRALFGRPTLLQAFGTRLARLRGATKARHRG